MSYVSQPLGTNDFRADLFSSSSWKCLVQGQADGNNRNVALRRCVFQERALRKIT